MMGISVTPDEDDTRTVITMVLVSGEERVKLRAEEEHLRMRQPSPSRIFSFIHFSSYSRR
jgi:hypothetical protein